MQLFHLFKNKKILICVTLCLLNKNTFADFTNELPVQPSPIPKIDTPKPQSPKHSKPHTKSKTSENKNKPQQEHGKEDQNKSNANSNSHNNNAPVYFSGMHGEGSRNTGILSLTGEAVVIQDDTTISSDKSKIFAPPGMMPSTGGGRIQKAIATGSVHIIKKKSQTSPEIKANCDEAEFYVDKRVVILKGHAKVWRADEYIHGDKIKIGLSTGNIEIIHPEGTIDPQSDKELSIKN